jgi:hypothetical protein
MLESFFHFCPEVCRETPHLHIIFEFMPRGSLLVIHIQGQTIQYLSPIFFGFLTYTADAISVVDGLMAGAGVPISMTELDGIHLMIIL